MAVVPLLGRHVDRENEIPQVLIHQRGPALEDQQIQAVLELRDGRGLTRFMAGAHRGRERRHGRRRRVSGDRRRRRCGSRRRGR